MPSNKTDKTRVTPLIDTCGKCGGFTRVLECRGSKEYRRRRRECKDCGHRFTTYESRINPTLHPPLVQAELENLQYDLAAIQQRISDFLEGDLPG